VCRPSYGDTNSRSVADVKDGVDDDTSVVTDEFRSTLTLMLFTADTLCLLVSNLVLIMQDMVCKMINR